ncbi:MAG: response regulator [Bacteroidota bacterium]
MILTEAQLPGNPLAKKTLLVLDDDSSIQFLLNALLAPHYAVVGLADGLEGMSWLYEGNIPDMILLDVNMPRLNGLEFIQAIKSSGFFRTIPVMVLSAERDSTVEQTFLLQGAADFLRKPFNPEHILQQVGHHISLSSQKTIHTVSK